MIASDPEHALAELRASVAGCRGCVLAEGRTQVVFGAGASEADLMFVGEGPGYNEDKQGEPFVGQAGRLLTELLAEIGLARKDVYIANVVKCRPPENRDPTPEEIESCRPHLMRQIEIIKPQVICTLGRFATRLLAETEQSMGAVHGRAKQRTLAGIDTVIFPVFHPAAALYARTNREVLAEDFGRLRVLLERGAGAFSRLAENTAPKETPEDGGQDGGAERGRQSGQGPRQTEQLPLW